MTGHNISANPTYLDNIDLNYVFKEYCSCALNFSTFAVNFLLKNVK